MTEPRPARATSARRRRKAVVAASVVVIASVLLGLGALVASDVLRLGGGPGPALAEHADDPTTTTIDDAARACRARLGPDDPLRLWIAGDSLAGSLGPALGERAAATGIVAPVYDSRVSSGLADPDFFDWPEHATTEMAALDPEVVVFIIGANDWRAPTSVGGGTAWQDEYRAAVEQTLTIFEDGGDTRHVFWVGSPTMQERRKDQGAQQVNELMREVVAQHERATYVDAYELFSDDDADGGYAASLPGPGGKDVRVRAGDGVHLTVEGAELLGDHVYAQLEPRCDLDGQAVPDRPQPVVRTKGSDGPGGASGQGSGSGGATVTTSAPVISPPAPDTTPTTAAPVTDPPTAPPADPPADDPPVDPPGGGSEEPTSETEP